MSSPMVRKRSRTFARAIRIPSGAAGRPKRLPPSYVELHTRSQWKPGYQRLKRVPYLTDKAAEIDGAETFSAESDGRR
jgi:hypothetical protein